MTAFASFHTAKTTGPQTLTSEQKDIAATVQRYIDGYLGQEAALLRQAFHKDAQMFAIDAGDVSGAATAAWFDRTETKRLNGGGTLSAEAEILAIDHTKDTAVAKLKLVFATHSFVDYLALLKTKAGWVIVNKIYATYTPEENPA